MGKGAMACPFEPQARARADMAIYHLRASVISRSSGRSATAAAAYRSGELILDRRTGLAFDYSKRHGVDHAEILAPEAAPAWVQDRAELWNRVEEAETRKNSQVCREIRVALPHELSHAQRIELVRGFCQRQFVDRGMIADIALHAPGREGDDRNHHAHILLTTREIGPEGFTAKNRDWNAKELLQDWREAWAQDSNQALEQCGLDLRIDHRTLAAQRVEAVELAQEAEERGNETEALRQTVRAMELARPPLPQLSAGAWQMKERGIEVAAVRAWHEVRARAVEVVGIAQELAGHVRDWLGRSVGLPGPELAPAGVGQPQEEKSLAVRLREAWLARQSHDREAGITDPGAEAAKGMVSRWRETEQAETERQEAARRAAELQREQELEAERQQAQEIERARELEQRLERERRQHDRGLDWEL